MAIKTYSELCKFSTFNERFNYLRLNGKVGDSTFGSARYLNQKFYREDAEWLEVRDLVIIRDNGCDLGIIGHEITGYRDPKTGRYIKPTILIHHLNPLTKEDILQRTQFLLDPEYLICVTLNTHNAIHYGDESLLIDDPIIRRPNDTCPWHI